jgi:hypothetical protein
MSGGLPPPYESAMTPAEYLEFAITDMAEESNRSYVNAFGNVKRALHLAIDILLNQYGLFTHYKRSNFPHKLKVLDAIGILPITIMQNLNVERNLIEHEYSTPSAKRVKEAVDVTKLLVMAIEKLLEATPHECVVGWRQPKRHFVMRLEPIKGEIHLFSLIAKGMYRRQHGISHFSGSLRSFTGELKEGVQIAKTPWKVFKLNKTNFTDWHSIIKELVNVQRREARLKSYIDKESASVTIPITIPLPILPDISWADLLDSMTKKHFEENKNEKNDSD